MDILILIIVGMVSFFIAVYGQIIIHELGHLIGAKLTRFKLVSFSVGNFILYKQEGKLRFKRSIILAPGQCLVSPSENNNKKPFRLYFLGGGLANIITTLILIGILLLNDYSLYISIMLYMFIFWGAFFALLNLLPIKILGNDGYHVYTLSKYKSSVDDLYKQQRIVKLLTDGKSLRQMPEEYFNLPKGNLDNIVTSGLLYYIFIRYIENHDFDNAKKMWFEYKDGLYKTYKNEFEAEIIFIETVTTNNPEIINRFFEGDTSSYIQTTRALRFRLFYAIELLVNKNLQLADESLKALDEISKKIIYEGSVKTNYELVALVKKHYEESKIITKDNEEV